MTKDKVLVVGCGRIGAPLLTFLKWKGFDAYGVDINEEILGQVKARFKETHWQEVLQELMSNAPYIAKYEDYRLKKFDTIIVTVGTPIDNNQNPDTSQLKSAFNALFQNGLLSNNPLIILRSTIFPGGTNWLRKYMENEHNIKLRIVFCPERIAEGNTFDELENLPQIIAYDDHRLMSEVIQFFNRFNTNLKTLGPQEGGTKAGELAKLMCNGYRYVNFALANEYSMIASTNYCDYNAIREAVNTDYPRANLAKAALNLGGPCLGKDAKILSAFSEIDEITEAAYRVAEKTCIHYINEFKGKIPYCTIGILGLGFKPNSDNNMNSLSYKAIKHLEILGAKQILVSDPYIKHPKYHVDIDKFMSQTPEIVIVMTEHSQWKDLKFEPWQAVIRL
jgi:UDP-N-acetyl-D-mannosaminuronic acid dehydrogenase